MEIPILICYFLSWSLICLHCGIFLLSQMHRSNAVLLRWHALRSNHVPKHPRSQDSWGCWSWRWVPPHQRGWISAGRRLQPRDSHAGLLGVGPTLWEGEGAEAVPQHVWSRAQKMQSRVWQDTDGLALLPRLRSLLCQWPRGMLWPAGGTQRWDIITAYCHYCWPLWPELTIVLAVATDIIVNVLNAEISFFFPPEKRATKIKSRHEKKQCTPSPKHVFWRHLVCRHAYVAHFKI